MSADPDDPDDLRPVRVVDGVVSRPAHPWTPTVHSFLRHLRAEGLDVVPEPLRIEAGTESSTEYLSEVVGEAGRDGWFAQHDVEGVRSAARLLRRVHDASRSWTPPADAVWGAPPVEPRPDDGDPVVCHGDPGPWNIAWRAHRAVGIFDWDFAHPGPRVDDVAYALLWFAPARSDEHCRDWHHFPAVPDRAARITAFLDAYGRDALPARFTGTEVPAAVERRMEATAALEAALAVAGVQPQATWVAQGHLEELRAERAWVREHARLLVGHPEVAS